MTRRVVAAAAAAILLGGCSQNEQDPLPVFPSSGPYVVTAIDYHFHDAHPSLPIPLDRALEFSNQGSNVHNVTVPGTGIDRNFRPGVRFGFEPVRSLLAVPGRYPFYCKLHRDRGMSGTLIVAPARD